jgi:eukaryotic-like serine/threonine-protein kinase
MATFRWGAEIGTGGFGVVKEARFADETDPRNTGQPLAAKFLRDDLLNNEDAINRFAKEVRLLSRLDHPHIIKVVGRNLSKMPPWFVMPRAERNLGDVIAAGGLGERVQRLNIFRFILEAITYAHQQNVIHRDLKPGNVLFVQGLVMVSDFGLGKQLDSESTELTLSAEAMGTLRYMAPEQLADAKRVKAPADVYSLGKILWELLSDRQPEPFLPPDLARIPGDFRAFVARCCERNPDDRYPNAEEALAAFDVLAAPTDDRRVDPPLDAAEALVKRWLETPSGNDLEVLREFDAHLNRYSDEESMYFELVPRLPDDLIEQYIRELPNEFASMLEDYNGHIAGGLPFSYTDVVANFYFSVWLQIDLPRTKRMILARLIEMGASHNRFHVGGVVARLLASIEDRAIAQLAAEVIRADPEHARWFTRYVGEVTVPGLVADAFNDVAAVAVDEPEGFVSF